MQQQTLVLYTRLQAAKKMPAGFFAPSPSPGTPAARTRGRTGGGDGRDGVDAEDAAGDAACPSASGVMEAGSKALYVMSRGLGNHGALGMRMIVTVWRGWARSRAVVTRRVTTLQRRWLTGRTRRWLRAWHRLAATGEREAAAAAASVRRYQRRCQRRVFITWRGVTAGLATHELALMGTGVGMFTPGSPAAGLAAIAAMARRGGGNATATTNPTTAGGVRLTTSRGAAVAAAMAAAGEEEEGGGGVGTPGSQRFATPLSTPGDGGWGDRDEVFATPAAEGWARGHGEGESPATVGDYYDGGGAAGGRGPDFGAGEDEFEGRKVKALLTWIEDILENDGLLPEDGFDDDNDDDHHGSVRAEREGAEAEAGVYVDPEDPESPMSLASASRAAAAAAGMLTPERKRRERGDSSPVMGLTGRFYSPGPMYTAASTPTPQASPVTDIAGRTWQQRQHLSPSAYQQTPNGGKKPSGSAPGSAAPPGGSGSRSSSRKPSPLVSAFDAAAAAVSPSRVRVEVEPGRAGGASSSSDPAVDLADVAISVEETETDHLDHPDPSGGSFPVTPRTASAMSAASRRVSSSSSPRGGKSPASDRARMARDAILSLAFERSAVAEAAVQMLGGQRVRALSRRVLNAWLSSALRSWAEAAEEELRSLKSAQAAAAAAEAAAAAAAAAEAEAVEAEAEAADAVEAAVKATSGLALLRQSSSGSSARRWFAAAAAMSTTPPSPRAGGGRSAPSEPSEPGSPGPSAPASPLKRSAPASPVKQPVSPPPPAAVASPAEAVIPSEEAVVSPPPEVAASSSSSPAVEVTVETATGVADGPAAPGPAAAEEIAEATATTAATATEADTGAKRKQAADPTRLPNDDKKVSTSKKIEEPPASKGCGCVIS
jgi:hypothetical protein